MSNFEIRWDLRIVKCANGYRCSWLEEIENDEARIVEVVFEEEGIEHGEIEAFQRLLWFITEHFGMSGSKHDSRRINTVILGGEE